MQPPSPRPSPASGRGSTSRAAALRRQQTDAERTVWFALRDRRLAGAKFRRQVPIGPFIVDFLCKETKFIVEVDGGQHASEDPARQRWLEAEGYVVQRFWNNEVVENLPGVLQSIASTLSRLGGRGQGEGGQSGNESTP